MSTSYAARVHEALEDRDDEEEGEVNPEADSDDGGAGDDPWKLPRGQRIREEWLKFLAELEG